MGLRQPKPLSSPVGAMWQLLALTLLLLAHFPSSTSGVFVYLVQGGTCGESEISSAILSFARMAQPGLQPGRCSDHGYDEPAGTSHGPQNTLIRQFTRPSPPPPPISAAVPPSSLPAPQWQVGSATIVRGGHNGGGGGGGGLISLRSAGCARPAPSLEWAFPSTFTPPPPPRMAG
eukprot:COSAG01_NODE_3227_length_6384_cov_6.269690_5_plen_175_part_00